MKNAAEILVLAGRRNSGEPKGLQPCEKATQDFLMCSAFFVEK